MISPSVVYPPSPTEVRGVTKDTSANFRREVAKVLISIILFFIVYIILVVLAAVMACLTVYGGVALIISAPKFLALMLGLGLIGLGIMVLFFLVKFIFAVSRYDHSNSVEITEKDQPLLFAFIRKLSVETETAFPRKIFISPDVNACVFYDSGFWSMFLPVKKNLQIGLGLVNVLTVSEFKAVIAHEFGHFSQRSMKLGSFVYNVNKVIYNLLYHNSGYGNTLNVWANIHTLFAIFAALTVRIVRCIQWVLRQMYALVNKNYMALSREMEFHADAVAARVSGSNSLIKALERLDFADASYSVVLGKYSNLFKEKVIAENLYRDHQTVMYLLANEYKEELTGEMLTSGDSNTVPGRFSTERVQNRVNYKDQWASHPPIAERTRQLAALNIIAEENPDPAWTLFTEKNVLQQQLTKKIYAGIDIPDEAKAIDAAAFQSQYVQEQEAYRLPAVFRDFFNEREITDFEVTELIKRASDKNSSFEWNHFIRSENLRLPGIINGLKSDISTLDEIAQGNIKVKSFDFDGQKFQSKEAATVRTQLFAELKTAEESLAELDHQLLQHFYYMAAGNSGEAANEFEKDLKNYKDINEQSAALIRHINQTLELIAPFYSDESLTHETVTNIITELKTMKEPAFKAFIIYWMPLCDFTINPSLKEKAAAFLQADYRYFFDNSFHNTELDDYNFLLREIWIVVSLYKFKAFKHLLTKGLSFVPASEN